MELPGEDQALAMGDRVRTLRGGMARLEFPWTAVAMGDESQVLIEKSRQLTLQLESGRHRERDCWRYRQRAILFSLNDRD